MLSALIEPCAGEANFLGGVASVKGVQGFDPQAAKKRFFEIYIVKVMIGSIWSLVFVVLGVCVGYLNFVPQLQYAKPNSGIGFPGALELITEVSLIQTDVSFSLLLFVYDQKVGFVRCAPC